VLNDWLGEQGQVELLFCSENNVEEDTVDRADQSWCSFSITANALHDTNSLLFIIVTVGSDKSQETAHRTDLGACQNPDQTFITSAFPYSAWDGRF
jgi:hypothetical protein